jgi:hypothetical protein
MLKKSLAAFLLIGICKGALAGVSSIGPFVGQFNEGFENGASGQIFGSAPDLSGPRNILSNQATLTGKAPEIHSQSQPRPLYIWSSVGGFSLDDKTPAQGHVVGIPFDGTRGLTCYSSIQIPTARIDFQTPAKEFGGYWLHAVTRTQGGPITVTFLDGIGDVIDTKQFNYDYDNLRGVSEWFGWSSTTPIHSVTFTGFWASIDGIQVNLIPEPSTVLLLSISWPAFVSARRRKIS